MNRLILLLFLILASCSDKQQFESSSAIQENLSSRSINGPCSPPDTQDCEEDFLQIQGLFDITSCFSNPQGIIECFLFANYTYYVCDLGLGNFEVVISEPDNLFWGDPSCAVGVDLDCVFELLEGHATRRIMTNSIINYGLTPSCEKGPGNQLVTSTYTKLLCRTACTEGNQSVWVDCGESTGCCVKTENWCIDDDDFIRPSNTSITQHGSCSGLGKKCSVLECTARPCLSY